jgi:hypothetical protein
MIEIQIEKGYARNLDELLDILCNFDNEDFNGNNGADYLWECAKGYESNQEFVIDMLRMQYGRSEFDYETIAIEVCNSYFAHLCGCNTDFNYDLDVEDGYATITFAWCDME